MGLVAFGAASTMKQRRRKRAEESAPPHFEAPLIDRVRPDSRVPQERVGGAPLQHSGGMAVHDERAALVEELVDDEIEAALNEPGSTLGEAYDAVAPDELASEWLTRATEAGVIGPTDETLDTELAELIRSGDVAVISEGSLRAASAEEVEAAASAQLEAELGAALDEPDGLGVDESAEEDAPAFAMRRRSAPKRP